MLRGLGVDATEKMFDGTNLNGPVSLRNAILNYREAFIRTFTESLLTYGLGRSTDYRDMPVVRSVEREAGKNNYRFSSFVLAIVKSIPFQMRMADEVDSTADEKAKNN